MSFHGLATFAGSYECVVESNLHHVDSAAKTIPTTRWKSFLFFYITDKLLRTFSLMLEIKRFTYWEIATSSCHVCIQYFSGFA